VALIVEAVTKPRVGCADEERDRDVKPENMRKRARKR
jgi:hypothetical protein